MLPFRQLIKQNVQSFGRQTCINEFLPNAFHFVIQKRIVLPTERHRGQETPEMEVLRLRRLESFVRRKGKEGCRRSCWGGQYHEFPAYPREHEIIVVPTYRVVQLSLSVLSSLSITKYTVVTRDNSKNETQKTESITLFQFGVVRAGVAEEQGCKRTWQY